MAKKIKRKSKLYQWQDKAREGGACAKCGENVTRLTVDHIVPIFFIEAFDTTGEAMFEDEDNFQFLCMPCNKFKSCRLDRHNPNTKSILLKYLR